MTFGALHHVEIWVTDLDRAQQTLGWLLTELGYQEVDRWPEGVSYALGVTYLVLESGSDVSGPHDRRRAGVNHLAFHGGRPEEVERLAYKAHQRGWTLMFADRHPHAGGAGHYAAYLENADGFEVELVAEAH